MNFIQEEDTQKRKEFEEELQLEDEGVTCLKFLYSALLFADNCCVKTRPSTLLLELQT